jgi:putative tryptophan/tyrosine transport system substrate-binding protein
MRRRQFISLLSLIAAYPFAAHAEQPTLPVVGFVNSESASSGYDRMADLFRDGLQEAGYVQGQNVTIEYHWADGHSDRLPGIIADLIRRRVTVIAATTTPAALAAKASVTNIPVVFETGGDPMQLGLVGSLNHPGGNITGVSQSNREVAPKRLELLHEVLPQAKIVALLVNPENPRLIDSSLLWAAAKSLGVQLYRVDAKNDSDLDQAFANMPQTHASALIVNDDPFLTSHSERIGALAEHYRIPAIYKGREFVKAGGLMSYGTAVGETYHLAGIYTGRVLKGDKPGDLPIEFASKVELFINLKSANALGITIPLPVSGRADEVIE